MTEHLRPLDMEHGQFKGCGEFTKQRKNLPVGQSIRIFNYSRLAPNEDYFVIGENGFYNAKTGRKANPKEVLSRKQAPDGWCFEGLDLLSLPDEESKN